jgi:hypothetical protein
MRFSTACFLGLVFVMSAVIAQANTLTFSAGIPLQTTNINSAMSLSQFDPSLGTLNSATVNFSGELVGGWGYENANSQPFGGGSMDVILQQTLGISQNSNSLLSFSTSTPAPSLTQPIPALPAFDGAYDFGGPSGATISGWDTTQNGNIVYTTPSDLASYLGTGNVNFNLVANAVSSHLSAPNGFISRTYSNAGASVSVTYDFTPVPEPSTFALLGMSAIGFLAYTWRRNRKAV